MNFDVIYIVERRVAAKDHDLDLNLVVAVTENADLVLEESPGPGNVAGPDDINA